MCEGKSCHIQAPATGKARRPTVVKSAAPQIWSHELIPTAIRVLPSLDSFKRHLETHYFASP